MEQKTTFPQLNITREEYARLCRSQEHRSQWVRNTFRAFWVGGLICTGGQVMLGIYKGLGLEEQSAFTAVSMTLVFISALLTGLGIYDRIARYAGAGTLVPITGFANSVASPALEFKTEGLVTGLGAKLFVICGTTRMNRAAMNARIRTTVMITASALLMRQRNFRFSGKRSIFCSMKTIKGLAMYAKMKP